MRGGLIRRRLTIQRASSTANSLGEPVESWTTLYSAWGSVDAISAQERFASGSQQELATVTHRIRLRYRDDKVMNRLLYVLARPRPTKSLMKVSRLLSSSCRSW